MKKLSLFVLLMCPLMAWATVPAVALSDLLSPIKTMTSQFKQTSLNAKGRVLQRSKGKMSLQRPDKFRWKVISPSSQLIIADGKKLWIYDKDLEQVTVRPLKKGLGNSPAGLLTGSLSELKTRFIITYLNALQNKFKLQPKAKNSLIQWMVLSFRNEKLTHMEIADKVGQKSVFDFYNVRVNMPLSARIFRFRPPRGVDVVGSPD